MNRMKHYIQHRLNPLHIYCRLLDCGLPNPVASRLSTVYERWVYNPCMGTNI